MRITYNAPRYATFGSLQGGELFRTEEHHCLFVKLDPFPHSGVIGNVANAAALDSHSPNDVQAGQCTAFDTDERIIPVRSITVDFEELR